MKVVFKKLFILKNVLDNLDDDEFQKKRCKGLGPGEIGVSDAFASSTDAMSWNKNLVEDTS